MLGLGRERNSPITQDPMFSIRRTRLCCIGLVDLCIPEITMSMPNRLTSYGEGSGDMHGVVSHIGPGEPG